MRSSSTVSTVTWKDLPAWQRDNEYIWTGYRPASSSFRKCFASLSYLHNESVNIYSHLLGAILFSGLGLFLYILLLNSSSTKSTIAAINSTTVNSADLTSFACFFIGAVLCLGMSATYHTISNHSPSVARLGNKLDYVGIICLIVGSFIPSIFYGFLCYPYLQKFYWTMISTLGFCCTSVSIFDRFRTPAWRTYRALMFVAMGLSAIIPVIHALRIYGLQITRYQMGLTWLLLEGFLYILGATIYASRWPERSFPGSYDHWGSSHQLFHILVIMASISHFYGLCVAFNFSHQVRNKCF